MIKVEHNVIGVCGTNTYYVYDEDSRKGIIVDPAGDCMRIIERVAKIGMKPEAIFITHGHFDHILALDEVRKHFNIKAYAGVNERPVLKDSTVNLSAGFMGRGYCTEADVYLRDGEEIMVAGYRIKALEVPGHTVGSMCYYFTEAGIVFSGDTLFCESVGKTDFPGGSMSALMEGIRTRLFTLADDTVVYPGHGDFTDIGSEKKYNPYIRQE